jgi:hypothetical protein
MRRIGRRRRRLDPVFPADTDAMIQVSGLALVALIGCCFDALRISAALPGVALTAAVEYTAGYANMTEEHMEALKKRKVSILTIIFGDGDEECEALAPFGPVLKLEDVVEACGSG